MYVHMLVVASMGVKFLKLQAGGGSHNNRQALFLVKVLVDFQDVTSSFSDIWLLYWLALLLFLHAGVSLLVWKHRGLRVVGC